MKNDLPLNHSTDRSGYPAEAFVCGLCGGVIANSRTTLCRKTLVEGFKEKTLQKIEGFHFIYFHICILFLPIHAR